MRSLKILKYLFIAFVSIFFIIFLTLISSNRVVNEIFFYVSQELPLKYEKIDGNIYSGIEIKGLVYDDMIKLDKAFVELSLLPLLLKEVYIKELKLEKISFEDKFFTFLKESKDEESEEEQSLDLPFTLFVKNFELSLYDFAYEEQKIEELFLRAENIKSDFKTRYSLEFFINLKSNLANIALKGELEDKNYKINSKIDLKEYLQTSFLLDLNGNFEKLDFVLKNDNLEIKDDEKLKIKDTNLQGVFDIERQNLEISSLNSKINYGEIFSNLSAKARLEKLDINNLSFEASLETLVKKTIFQNLNQDIELISKIKGSSKEVSFESKMARSSMLFDKTALNIENTNLSGLAKLEDKNLYLVTDLNFDTNFLKQKSKLELKANIDDFKNLSLSVKTFIESLKYEDINLKPLGNLTINTLYKNSFLDINLNSKLVDLSLKSPNFKKFDFDLNIKNLNPNEFYKFDEIVQISKIKGFLKGYYDTLDTKSSFSSGLFLNDNFVLNSNFKSNKNSFESTIKNDAFVVDIKKYGEKIYIKSKVKELKNLEQEVVKILKYEPLNLAGDIDLDFSLSEDKMDFEVKSPKISLLNNSLEKISIKGEFKDDIVSFEELDFFIAKAYDVNFQKRFSILNRAFFNTKDLNSSFDFENISFKTSKDIKNTILNIKANKLSLEYSSYGNTVLDSNLNINIDENSKIFILGDIKLLNLKASYNIPALNISKDKDIIIVSKNQDSIKKDFFLQNIAMDLSITANDIQYSVKNIDLKANALLNLKKEFDKNLIIYGSVKDIKGSFSELGRTYNIEDSNVYFRGQDPVNPILDIKAKTDVDNISISILIGGSMNNPRLNLSSNPVMNQKDILSYLIFGTNFANNSQNSQSKQSQASLFLLNELSKDYAKELGIDTIYFEYDPATQYIETYIGKNLGSKTKVLLKNKVKGGELILMRELTKLWNFEVGFEEKTQSLDLMYKKRY